VAKRSPAALGELFERIGYKVRDQQLINRALTHASHGVAGRTKDYERLEFLGDRVLGLVAAEELYRRFPDIGEGDMSRRMNMLVRQESCTEVAQNLGLGDYIRWGTRTNDIANNPRVLADACEALIAAIYLDGGLQPAREFILRQWQDMFDRSPAVGKDPKTALQEWALARALPVPMYYEETRSGPDHLPVFVMMVEVDGHEPASGEGTSKRGAEQAAALAFLQRQRVKPWRVK
jgi:ribonuclease III